MKTTRVTRRQFLHLSAMAAGGGAQTNQPAAQPSAGAAAAQPTAAPAVAKPATINWWTVPSEEWSEEAQRKMLAAFEQANPNIKVNLTVLPADGYDEKMTTALGANQGAPDVALFWNSAWLPQTLDLEPLIKAEGFDKGQYIKGFWDT